MKGRAPAFWWREGGLGALLAPAAALTGWLTARRVARTGWRAPVPVLCCGNVTVGGAGKTTLALDLGARLLARGVGVHFLTRGYGGRGRGVHRVAPGDTAAMVGDEALLLAQCAPTWRGADRAAGARAAIAAGATALVMDDGLQNPGLVKTMALLTIDGRGGFGNARLLPAGPLREQVGSAARRCAAAVLIGEDARGAAALLPPALPVLRAWLRPDAAARTLAGRRVFAFAGIASPEKFFTTLREAGAELAACRGFSDHHPFSAREQSALLAEAARLGACPVTTPKDACRLAPEVRALVHVAGVELVWADAARIEALLDDALAMR